MSERSIQLRTQPSVVDASVSIDSADLSISPHGLSQAEKHTKPKPRFAEFACSQTQVNSCFTPDVMDNNVFSQVYCYAVLVTEAVIPKAFWGSDKNFKLILERKCTCCRQAY